MANQFKTASLKIGSLKLDSKNTRIPLEQRSDDQRILLHALLESQDVKGLAASIAKIGILPNERLIVMSDGGRHFIVLEGNRRLSAVKLLINPDLAPTTAYVKYFKNLAAKMDLTDISKLDVVIVPNRLSAAAAIAQLHIGQPKKPWSSLQQATFYREMAEEGNTPADISELTGTSMGEVRGFLRTELLFRIAKTLDLAPEVRRKVEGKDFPFTTLERFLDSPVARKFMGIEFHDDLEIVGKVHPERFKAALGQVVNDVATKKGLTREVGNKEGFEKYVADAETKLPETKKRGKFSPVEIFGETVEDEVPSSELPKPKPKPKPKPSKSVVPNDFNCSSKHAKVREIFKELKSMGISAHRNSSGVMMRVLLELSLWQFIKDSGFSDELLDHYDKNKKRRSRNPDWIPPVRDLISYVVDKRKLPGMTADEYKQTRLLASKDADSFLSIEGFNYVVHNPGVIPLEDELRRLWHRAEPLLRVILN